MHRAQNKTKVYKIARRSNLMMVHCFVLSVNNATNARAYNSECAHEKSCVHQPRNYKKGITPYYNQICEATVSGRN